MPKGGKADGPPHDELVSSSSIRFLNGPNNRDSFLPSALVTRPSPVLDSFVDDDLRNLRDGLVMWKDLDVNNYVCLPPSIYAGDYDEPVPRMKEANDKIQENEAVESWTDEEQEKLFKRMRELLRREKSAEKGNERSAKSRASQIDKAGAAVDDLVEGHKTTQQVSPSESGGLTQKNV
ncbi:hypothetical protein XA68_13555 [Ophiocordyceps unilateralis]|uniref:Uncharacterized protein n=1 Tax=Ophiocordyceps unilateralis TaxID=268505 RepID=A0A2A9PC89_OPHUN|nr:hypothetical protein XA68_13555 [Ophiocordyceps unilateralis]